MSHKPQSPHSARDPKGDDRKASEWNRVGQLAFEFLGYLGILGYLGWMLDQRYGWDGRGLFTGLMVALVVWVYRVLRASRDLFK